MMCVPGRRRNRRRGEGRAVPVALAAAAILTVPAPAIADPAPYDRAVLQRDLDAIRDTGVTGVLADVRTGQGRLVVRSGVAELGTHRPFPYDGYFRMWSNTKTFTATVVLQLVAEGKLSLTDTVEKWLPGVVTGNGNDGSRITVKNLLRQTSGLHDYASDLWKPTADQYREHRFDTYRSEQLAAMAMRKPPRWVPDPKNPAEEQRWEYSNTNYLLAGMLIEKVTRHPWEREVHERVLEPLGLRKTFAAGSSAYVPEPRANGYHQFTDGGPLVDTTLLNLSIGGPGGGLITTTGDLTRFWQALLGGRLLRPAQLAEMKKTVEAKELHQRWPGARYGLGIMRFRLTCEGKDRGWYWTHSGAGPGSENWNGFTADGRHGVVLSVSATPRGDATNQAIAKTIEHAMCAATAGARG